MRSGYHKCQHCDEWHYCSRSKGGCLEAVAALVLSVVFLVPLMMMAVDFWGAAICENYPNSKYCPTRRFFTNEVLEKRVKALEEKEPNK